MNLNWSMSSRSKESCVWQVDEVAKQVLEKHGRVDVLVNNAGAFPQDTSMSAEEGAPV